MTRARAMRFTLMSRGEPVGWSDLDHFDRWLQAATGVLTPGPALARHDAVLARLDSAAAAAMEPPPPAPGQLVRRTAMSAGASSLIGAATDELRLALVDAEGASVATTFLTLSAERGERRLLAGLARPEEWLARYGAPYRTADEPPGWDDDQSQDG